MLTLIFSPISRLFGLPALVCSGVRRLWGAKSASPEDALLEDHSTGPSVEAQTSSSVSSQESHPECHSESHPECHSESHPECHSESHPESDSQSDSQSDSESDSQSDSQSDSESDSDSQSDSESDSESDPEDDAVFVAQMQKLMDRVVAKDKQKAKMQCAMPMPAARTVVDANVSLSLYVAEEDRQRFFQRAAKAAEKFGVKLVRPPPGNLVAPFLVKGKRDSARAYIEHMELFVHGSKTLRMPIGIPVAVQPLLKAKQAPGIWLQMPSKEEPSESCALVGKAKDRTQMLKTFEKLQGQLGSLQTASPAIAPEHYGKAIGKKGDRLKYIHEKYNVRVTVPKDESPITISGKSESVRDAIKELEELVQQDVPKQHVFLPVNILPEDLGVAIGKGGSQFSKVQEEFGVKLYTKCNKHPQSPLVVVGPLEEAQKAVAYIEQHVAERHRLNEERAEEQRRREEVMETFPVNIESRQIGRVIGKGGFRISYIAKRYSVKIQLPERNKEDGAVLVTGLKEDAQAAAAALELMANRKLLPEHILVPLRISREENLIVLGPEGCRAAWVEREFGVRLVRPVISMPLMVEGGVEAVASAVAFVEEMVANRLLALKEGN